MIDFGSQIGTMLEASWLQKSMENQSKKAWAFPHRSGDAPGSCRAGIIDFSMVFGGLGGVRPRTRHGGRHAEAVQSRPPKQVFQRQPKHHRHRHRRTGVQAYRRTGVQAQGLGLGCLAFNAHSHRRAERGGGYHQKSSKIIKAIKNH